MHGMCYYLLIGGFHRILEGEFECTIKMTRFFQRRINALYNYI